MYPRAGLAIVEKRELPCPCSMGAILDSVVGMENRIRAGRSEVRIPVGARISSLFLNVRPSPGRRPDWLWDHPASCSTGIGVLSQE